MIVAFTGHRPDKLEAAGVTDGRVAHALLHGLSELHRREPLKCAISGMALGVDQIAAALCITCRLPFVAAVPHDGQDLIWPAAQRALYRQLLSAAQAVRVITPGPYSAEKMQRRNEWMVDQCDVLLAVWDGSTGGTANCVAYARRTGCEHHIIDPRAIK